MFVFRHFLPDEYYFSYVQNPSFVKCVRDKVHIGSSDESKEKYTE